MDEIIYLNIDDDSTGNQSYNQMSTQDNTTLDATSDSPPGLKIKERVKFLSNWTCTSTRGSDEVEGNSTRGRAEFEYFTIDNDPPEQHFSTLDSINQGKDQSSVQGSNQVSSRDDSTLNELQLQ